MVDGSFVGPVLPMTIQLGQTFDCTFVVDGPGSACTVSGTPVVNDHDGVPAAVEAANPYGVDGNGDGGADADQPYVTSLPGPSGDYVTVAGPANSTLGSVTVTDTAGLPALPGTGQSSAVGYTLQLAPEETSATVKIRVPDPAPTMNKFFKLQNNVWVDATNLVQSFTPLGDGRTEVALTLTDGAFGDEDGQVNGVIVDPGLFATVTVLSYQFSGFQPPLSAGVNKVNAGSTVPLKWRLTTSAGKPVVDRASMLTLKLVACAGGGPADIDLTAAAGKGLTGKSDGSWQIDLKTEKSWTGCRTLRLTLADNSVHDVVLQFK
jgi:hypothetical protein